MMTILLALALQQESTEAGLKQVFEKLQQAIGKGDEAAALAQTNALLPDEVAFKKGLKDGTTPESIAQALDFYAKLIPAEPAKRAALFKANPANSEIRVFRATTEELVKYEPGTTAFMEFPGGARKLAESVLRPGTAYYEVLLAKPGEKSGMKFHLFFWTGERWAMLGPLWRAFK